MGAPDPGLSRASQLSLGRFEERYAIGEPLGAGGMGEVLVCRDRRIGRDVALKVMRDDHAGNFELVTRFLREARIQGQLEHPSVVPVYDLGLRGDASLHFTMKRVAGRTLREVIDLLRDGDPEARERHSRRVLVGALSRVCIAVAYAHDRGVVHRDLKPANVILGDFGEVYVLDWGVAKLVAHEEPGSSRSLVRDSLPDTDLAETRVGSLLGTPGYMAPEQLRGEAVDERADVYALGAILFELLTLEPLHADRAQGEGDASPRRRAPELEIPVELDAVVVRATEADPDERLASARAMHDALQAYLDVEGDVERRRELARQHARQASEALACAEREPDGLEHRLRALRDLNAARALDPANGAVLASLLRLVAELPPRPPAEVEAELEAQRVSDSARSSRHSALAYLMLAAILGLLALGAARAPAPLWLVAALSLATAAHAWLAAEARQRFAHFCAGLALETLVTAGLCVLFGPLLLVPGVLLAVSVIVIVHQRASSRLRWTIMAVSMAAMLVPLALSWAGVLPSFYRVQDGVFSILPWAIELTPLSAYAILGLGSALCLFVPLLLVGSSVDGLGRAERRFAAQAWYLKQLVAGGEPPQAVVTSPLLHLESTPPQSAVRSVSRRARATDPDAPTRAADARAIAATVLAESSAPGIVRIDDAPAPASSEDPGFASRYRVDEPLGQGGMGEVRRCRDRWVGREVALKALKREHGADDELVDRFVREARIQGRLEHPAVLPVYDLGVREDGSVYFTMKRALGLTLREILERLRAGDPQSELKYGRRALLGALARVCIAVAYAHSRGVVHRDLKPENVIVGDWDDVYVLDWGIAKLSDKPDTSAALPAWQIRDSLADAGDVSNTQIGTLIGSPGYMAPEQVLGREVDARADVYALGALLFEVLALEPLHRGNDTLALMESTLSGIDRRPSVRGAGREIPPELDTLCERATAPEPEDRVASARELHDLLMRYLDGQRDRERRAELVTTHLTRAEDARNQAAAAGTTPQGIALRVTALAELNSALALDPSNRVARAALVALLDDVPARPPAAVERELHAAGLEERIRAARRATIGYGAIFFSVAVLALTADEWNAALGAILISTSVAAAHTWLFGPARGRKLHVILSLALSAASVASLSALLGPLVIGPTIALAMAVTVIVHARAKPRVRTIVAASYAVALILPLLLELAGVLPPSYAFRDGVMEILPRAISLGEVGATALLIVATLFSLAVPTLLVGRSIDALGNAERRQAAQVWLLRRSLPD